MVYTRSAKKNVLDTVSKSTNKGEIDHTYDCTIVISIHKDAIIKFGESTHVIKQKKNDFNVRLHLISDKKDSNEVSAVDDTPHDNVSSRSNQVQVYQPTSAMSLKSVNSAWVRCKNDRKKNKQKLVQHDVVLAKLRGHPAWPAIILDIPSQSTVKVQFFGAETHEKFGFVNINEITLFKNSMDVLLLLLQKKIKKFTKAVKEAELVCGISGENSLFNECNDM